MPTYDYSCSECGGFEALRSLSVRNDPAACPECGLASQRMLSAAPSLALMEATTRTAMSVNERARHEPKRSGDYQRLKHPSGCGCCSTAGKRGATVTGANGNKAFPSKRPWMISH
jgi:putative FmdB family regulatory protein